MSGARLRLAELVRRWRHMAYRLRGKYLYSSRAHRAFRQWLWPVATESQGLKVVHRETHDALGHLAFTEVLDPRAHSDLVIQTERWRRHDDTIVEITGPIRIEPGHSLAIVHGKYFIWESRGLAHDTLVPPLAHRFGFRSIAARQVDALVHLDGFLGRNLFHFFNDSLSALYLLRQVGMLAVDLPVLIHRQVYDQPFVRDLLTLPVASGLNLLVQEPGEMIETKRLVKAIPSNIHFQQAYAEVAARVHKNPHRRIFLDRRPKYQRRLRNDVQAVRLLQDQGFEQIFGEDLSFGEQGQLMAEASHVVALHGAGMTNLLFADLPRARILELNSSAFTNPVYVWMTKLVGCSYHDLLYGSALDRNWNYSIDLAQLGAAVQRLIRE